MSNFAGAVHIATTDGPAGRRGITVTAACSVSDDPASILICVNRNNPFNSCFFDNGVFALNTLAASHEPLARAFAGEGALEPDRRFALGKWDLLETGAPVLAGSLAAFDCRIVETMQAATHTVLIGRVAKLKIGDSLPPLLYHRRDYHVL